MPKYSEDNLQRAVARYLDYSGLLWCHVANERATSPRSGANLKKKGVKKGVPDVLVFEPAGNYNGLAIELKCGKNTTTKHQTEWLENLEKKGWACFVCRDLDMAICVIENYLSKK